MVSRKENNELKKDELLAVLARMQMIRFFELYAEGAYLQGKIGGFFHSSMGQEAIAIAAVKAFGKNQWFLATYRIHSLALALEEDPNQFMAELFGKETGNVKGRGGSMHFALKTMLGGFGIVGGHIPIAAGAAFSCKYLKEKDKISLCFLGEGAAGQGSFYETLNLTTLWDLPCIFIIENNQWAMGTSLEESMTISPLGEKMAKLFGIKGYTVDGMDFFSCYTTFSQAYNDVKKNSKPVIIEAHTHRFKGHSISDPGLYRSKEELEKAMKLDPIIKFKNILIKKKWLTEKQFEKIQEEQKQRIKQAIDFAEKAPWPDPLLLEEDIFAKETQI